MNSAESFAADYQDARSKFLLAAREAGGEIESVGHPDRGPDGGELEGLGFGGDDVE